MLKCSIHGHAGCSGAEFSLMEESPLTHTRSHIGTELRHSKLQISVYSLFLSVFYCVSRADARKRGHIRKHFDSSFANVGTSAVEYSRD